MTYEQTVAYLYAQLPAFQKIGREAIKPKLTNITQLCSLLGNPQDNFPSVHVAGTNGKGSSSHFLASILQEAGYKVGLYTSPHLKDYRERFRINGQLVSENYVIDFVENHKNEIADIKPSFFEVSVALAFKLFSDEQVDLTVVEVGLGGRLDSTNIISNILVSLITNIGYDHTDILGNTLAEIAFEKAGIIKTGVPVVISEYNSETLPVFNKTAEQIEAPIHLAKDNYHIVNSEESIVSLDLQVQGQEGLLNLSSGLVGQYQKNNILGVLTVCKVLNSKGIVISPQNIQEGLKKVVHNTGLKGRWQILQDKPLILCDTGHNEHAFKITINRILSTGFTNLFFILGFVKDKNLEVILDLIPTGATVFLCEFDSFRALNASELSVLTFKKTNNISIFKSVNLALIAAKALAKEDDVIFIGGSTYLVAEINDL